MKYKTLLARFSGFHHNFRRVEECSTLLRWLDPKPGEKILDVGCGDGFYTEKIARKGAEATGIDIRKKALVRARKRCSSQKLRFMEMDAEELDFPENYFDKVISFCVIEHLQDDEKTLRQIARLLKPGGRLFLSADSLSNPGLRAEEKESHRRRYRVNQFYDREVVSGKLQQAGLKLERSQFVLSSPLALALARFSWRLDDLPAVLLPLRFIGYLLLGTIGLLALRLVEPPPEKRNYGLTLLVEASRPQ
ncbi:MAG: methyltransferase domain-containing protein [Candidatus Saccharicenans sp.]|nr:methyltransferase domain-containing protein [Candidatus Saccharicenans sp.]MDH7493313.1 methyltransferase domain-containing protein [Candidatus Saccharicenans sp.]